MAEAPLADLQRRMQHAILAGGAAPAHAAKLVRGDDRLPGAARLGIYARAYRARLIECLRGEYPALRLLAGDTAFDLFASGYIAACPPAAPSLYALGAGFAAHLEEQQPPEAREPGSLLALPAQLARLERARAEVQRAEGVEREPPLFAAGLALVLGARLRVPDSIRLLRLGFDFRPLLDAADRGEAGPIPKAADAHVAVARSGWRVGVHSLDAWRYALLEALGPDGADIQCAAASAAAAACMEPADILTRLSVWLPDAAREGLVARG